MSRQGSRKNHYTGLASYRKTCQNVVHSVAQLQFTTTSYLPDFAACTDPNSTELYSG